jgi:ubiquinone/menaquinone biosynthesis C-methylase UbiE
MTFLEIGPGDCSLSLEVAKHVKTVYAVDVSSEISANSIAPNNFVLVISDGISIPLEENSVDVVYSNQVMEHLHPDDAREQTQEVYRVLVPTGTYVCLTPNRLSGPYDVSRHFDTVATGFHLKEYTNTELERLFRDVGFSAVRACMGIKGRFAVTNVSLARWCEGILEQLPASIRNRLGGKFPLRSILGVQLVAQK